MNRITITAGVGYDIDRKPITQEAAMAAVINIRKHIAAVAGGFTETSAIGGWSSRDGELVQEPAIRWMVVSEDDERAHELAHFVAKALHQDSVMLEVEEVRVHAVESLSITEKFERMDATTERTIN